MTCRKPLAPIVFLMLLFTATTATAGTGLFGGVNFPTGDFNDGAKTGWNVGGYYTLDMAAVLDIGLTAGYTDFGSESSGKSPNAWEIQGIGHLKVLFLKGYLGMGVANYRSPLADKRKTKLAWQMGVCAQIAVLEARLGYHQIPGDNDSVNWISLSAGVTF
jgi:hypothetical protein